MGRKRRQTGTIAVLTALLGMVVAQPAPSQQGVELVTEGVRTIRVTGVGDVQVAPDLARIQLAVETIAPTAQAAGQENARQMDRVIAALVEAGIPREVIETENYSVYPQYVHDDGREPRISGYQATNRVSLETEALQRVGALIDVALRAGANRLEHVGFELKDSDEAQAAALREAVQQARSSALTIAAALGVRLGVVRDASTAMEPVAFDPVVMARMESQVANAPPPTPIQPGKQTVNARVVLVFEIEAAK